MKIIKKIYSKIMQKRGYDPYMAQVFLDTMKEDLKNNNTTFVQKVWAYKRGFFSDKIESYNLNDDNYKSYLSDFEYLKMYPLNNQYKMWIDDKLTTKYILSSKFKDIMPEYYYEINEKGKIIKLTDCPLKYETEIEDIIQLLKDKKALAVKLIAGSLGKGFYKCIYQNNNFFVNDEKIDKNQLKELLSKLKGYIITEFLTPNEELAKIYPHTANSLRVMLINPDGDNPIIPNAFIRFGRSNIGPIDNASSGGIFAIVDVDTGEYSKGKILNKQTNKLEKMEVHPDTNIKINGTLPYWEDIKNKLYEMSRYIPQLSYLGLDVVITNEGFKILEINSHQDIKYIQYYYPLLKDNKASQYYNNILKRREE